MIAKIRPASLNYNAVIRFIWYENKRCTCEHNHYNLLWILCTQYVYHVQYTVDFHKLNIHHITTTLISMATFQVTSISYGSPFSWFSFSTCSGTKLLGEVTQEYIEYDTGIHGTWKSWWMNRMNGIMKYRQELKKNQQIAWGWMKLLQHWKKIKRHKAPGMSGLVAEMIQATGDIWTQWISNLCNGIVKEGCIPENWKSSVVLPIYKRKRDPMECGSYRGIKLLDQAMKVVERIIEHRI